MEALKITNKKKNKIELSFNELKFVVDGFVSDKVTKQEMTDFLFASINFGLSDKETFDLTQIMVESGNQVDLSNFEKTIDKHSTGGVSDTTTLIVVPLFALLGYTCVKMSGKALSHTGGTADKLTVFDGFQNNLSIQKAKQIAKECGACFITSTDSVAPADKKIYALRDEINAMSIPLIASSIMSKKIASGARNLILDVKFGQGAFIKTKTQAHILAKLMKKIGEYHGVKTQYVLGDMNQALGSFVGNHMEVWEVLQTLKNAKLNPLLVHSLNIVATAIYKDLKMTKHQAYLKAYDLVKNGQALKKLEQIITLQGGSFELLGKNYKPKTIVKATKNGIISYVDVKALGFMDKHLNGSIKDYLGFEILKRKGDNIKKDEPLFNLYFEYENKNELTEKFNSLIRIK